MFCCKNKKNLYSENTSINKKIVYSGNLNSMSLSPNAKGPSNNKI